MNIITLENSTASSKEASKVLEVDISQIIKTLVFHFRETFFIVILSGDRKLNYSKARKLLSIGRPSMASAKEVYEITGAPVGGVMPIFDTNLPVILDVNVTKFDKVYGGGGDLNKIMEVTPEEIIGAMNPIIWDIGE